MVREAVTEDLEELLQLYLYLHEQTVPALSEYLLSTWNRILEDENHHLIVKIVDGRIVSSCVCVIIPNLTRNVRPYAFVENVVTHGDYRGKGYATEAASACLDYASDNLPFKTVYSFTAIPNKRSERVMQKIGMHFEKEFDHPLVEQGHWLCRHILYKIEI